MSNDQSRYVLKPRPPVRAFVVAAVLTLLGSVLVAVLAAQHAATLWLVLAMLLMAAGVALAVLAALSLRTMRTFVQLDREGYHITGPGTDRRGTWADVTRVTTSAGGAYLTLYHGEVGRTHILCPGGAGDAQMSALVADVAKHLDADRGYGDTFRIPVIDPHNPDPDVVA